MKAIKVLLTLSLMLCIVCVFSQRREGQNVLIATSEEEAYRLLDRMLDSARLSNHCLYPDKFEVFGFTFFRELSGTDIILKFELYCGPDGCSDHFYRAHLSSDMPLDFYARLLDYFANILDKKEDYCIRYLFEYKYTSLRLLLIKRYESGKLLDRQDSLKALALIERTIIEGVTKGYKYSVLLETDYKYISDKVRDTLINIMRDPFYPEEYYEIFMSYQDTSFVDTTNIPDTTRIRLKYREGYGVMSSFYPEERVYYNQLTKLFWYARKGKREGLSPGQAYLKDMSSFFRQKGYLPIYMIERYAHERQDELLLKHVKEFKKRHPDYPYQNIYNDE